MASLVDANLIIRFLLNDNVKQAQAAKELFASPQKLHLPDLVVAEVIWVLKSVYGTSKEEIISKVQYLFKLDIFICNDKMLNKSLLIYLSHNISFVDSYLVAYAQVKKMDKIYSFDRGLDKVKSIKRKEP